MSETDLKEKELNAGQHDDLGVSQDDRDTEVENLENLYSSSPSKSKGNFWTKKKKAGAGIAGVIGGGAIIFTIFFSPILKLESYMQNINQRAFAVAGSAVESRASYLFERYMIGYLINLNSCTKAISLDCRQTYGGKGLVAGLYSSWSDAKIEAKLFDEYGIEVRTSKENGVVKHKLFDRRGGQIELSSNDNGAFRSIVSDNGRRETGREIRRFLKDSTKWYQVLERRSVRRFLERKHGIKVWCMMACKSRDNLDTTKETAAFKYKSRFINRFVSPFSSKWGFILQCMVSGNCNKKDIADIDINRKALTAADIEVLKDVVDNPNQKVSQLVLRNILTKLVKNEVADQAVNAVPVVGQVILAATILELIEQTDSFIADSGFSKLAADINSNQYLEYYTATRSDNDAMKAGAMDLEDLGEILNHLDGAEQSLVYKAYNGDKVSEEDDEYLCKDGEPIDVSAGDFVCEEKKIQRTYTVEQIRNSAAGSDVMDAMLLNYRLVQPVVRAALFVIKAISDFVIGNIVDLASDLIRGCEDLDDLTDRAPTEKELKECNGVDTFIKETGDILAGFVDGIFGRIFPLPVTLESPGREFYDGLEAGADVAANSFAAGGEDASGQSFGLGAPAISDEDVATIFDDMLAQESYEYNSQNSIAKMLDTSYRGSFASIFISLIPSNPSVMGVVNSVTGNLTKFINGSLFSTFVSPLSASANQYAGDQLAINAFGVERYGYKLDDPILTADPDLYTEEYCQVLSKQREEMKTKHPKTGLEQYETADPCQLERTAIEAAGGLFLDD